MGAPPFSIVTDDSNLAKKFGFSKHARHKKLYVKHVSESEVDEIYHVTRKGSYHGHNVLVVEYSYKANDYRIISYEMNLVEEMGFIFYDRSVCYKDVRIDEVLDMWMSTIFGSKMASTCDKILLALQKSTEDFLVCASRKELNK